MNKLTKGIITLVLYFLYPFFLGSLLPSSINSSSTELIIRTLFDVVFISIFVILYKDELKKEFRTFKRKPFKTIGTSLLYLLLAIFVMALSVGIVNMLTNGYQPHSQLGINELWPKTPIYAVWLTFIVSPFTDEIAFRKTFKDIIPNKILYVVLSSLTYGFYMIGYYANSVNDILCIIPYALFGVAISLSYLKTKTVVSPILIRILYSGWMLLGVILGQV